MLGSNQTRLRESALVWLIWFGFVIEETLLVLEPVWNSLWNSNGCFSQCYFNITTNSRNLSTGRLYMMFSFLITELKQKFWPGVGRRGYDVNLHWRQVNLFFHQTSTIWLKIYTEHCTSKKICKKKWKECMEEIQSFWKWWMISSMDFYPCSQLPESLHTGFSRTTPAPLGFQWTIWYSLI